MFNFRQNNQNWTICVAIDQIVSENYEKLNERKKVKSQHMEKSVLFGLIIIKL